MSADYEPGVCNIGPGERRVRYGFGAVGFAAAVAVVVAVPALSLPDRWLLLTFVPLLGGFVGYYQGREAFCVRFAVAGVSNLTAEVGRTTAVPDAAAARADRRRAARLVARAAAAALAVSLALYLLVPRLAG